MRAVGTVASSGYSFRYRTRTGDRKRYQLGTHGNITADEARKLAKQRAGEVAGGSDPAADKKAAAAVAGNTVSTVWDAYRQRELITKRSAIEQERSFDQLVQSRIGERSIYELRRGDMVKLLDGIEDNNGHVIALACWPTSPAAFAGIRSAMKISHRRSSPV